ncbi:ATP synthase subunit g, mitochondrial [Drosophila albomicans]|uniref:ATP synthase subunit g n=1 Tax=Drosophila albomicans TaxID=7291 RepID=A0A6P8WN20_DROAB|nr:ATP synthase subunit g, mitochondrial [Drosophila albomicans]
MASLGTKITTFINAAKAQARPLFDEFMYYAKVELTPPTPADFKHFREQAAKSAKSMKKDLKSSGNRLRSTTVAEAWLNTLVTIEVITWFFMGEVIGRRHLVGYKV